MQLNRFHLVLAFIALMLLRFVVGFHFFKEGTYKLKNGFDAGGFLQSAKGPLAPHFKAMLDDPDGTKRFGVEIDETAQGPESVALNPDLTYALWEDFLHRTASHYRFGDRELVDRLKQDRAFLAEEIRKLQSQGETAKDLEVQRAAAERKIKKIRTQTADAREILENAKKELGTWLQINQVDLIAHFGTEDREDGFERDGENKASVALYVDSLRDQVAAITSDRKKKLYGWKQEVDGMWTAYEGRLNELAVEEQVERVGTILAHRPFDQPNSQLKIINKFIPWFDTIVGVLLILGLFTRLASGAAAIFLISVVLTQPFWIPGTQPTYFYWIELAALLVIFATCAGRMGGLDFFLASAASKDSRPPESIA